MNYKNLSIKHLFMLLMAGVLLQSCEQQAVISTLQDEGNPLLIEEPTETSDVFAEQDDENIYIQEPYNDDPYFDYVQEYRYKGKVYTYADKDSYQELVDILNQENISVDLLQDLDELAAYELQNADVPVENRQMPEPKIAYIFDTQQASDAFLDNHYKQIYAIQGSDVESRDCTGSVYDVILDFYKDVNFRGQRYRVGFAGYRNQVIRRNVPGYFNDEASSYKANVINLPGNLNRSLQVTLRENYNQGGRYLKSRFDRRCYSKTYTRHDLRIFNMNDRASSFEIRLVN